jgi:hypothetical protein
MGTRVDMLMKALQSGLHPGTIQPSSSLSQSVLIFPVAMVWSGGIFVTFNERWVAADPKNVLEFPKIFEGVKADMRKRLLSSQGDHSWQALFM